MPILFSRFMLNLRQVDQPASVVNTDRTSVSMPSFAVPESRLTGNFGEDLQHFGAVEEDTARNKAEDVQNGSANSMYRIGVIPAGPNIGFGLQNGMQNETVSLVLICTSIGDLIHSQIIIQ